MTLPDLAAILPHHHSRSEHVVSSVSSSIDSFDQIAFDWRFCVTLLVDLTAWFPRTMYQGEILMPAVYSWIMINDQDLVGWAARIGLNVRDITDTQSSELLHHQVKNAKPTRKIEHHNANQYIQVPINAIISHPSPHM